MRIKQKHLTKSDRVMALRKRRERAERERQEAAKRSKFNSEFITHIRLLDTVHEHWRGAYTVRARGGFAIAHKSEIKTAHLASVKQEK